MIKDLLPEIRHDIRQWKPSDPLDMDKEADVFAPNTLSVLLAEWPDLIIDPWDAERLIDRITDRILSGTDDKFVRLYEQQRRGAASAKKRMANLLAEGRLPMLQQLVFDAERALGLSAPTSAIVQHLMLRGQAGVKTSNVERARTALRTKGL